MRGAIQATVADLVGDTTSLLSTHLHLKECRYRLPVIFLYHDALNAFHDIRQHRFAFRVEVDVRGNPVIYLNTFVIALEIFLLRHRVDVSVYLLNGLEIGGINERVAWKSFIDLI